MHYILNTFSKFSTLVIYPGAALLLASIMTNLCIRVFPRLGLVDIPRGRHIHKKPIPCAGGIAIAASFICVTLIYLINYGNHTGNLSPLKQLLSFLPAAAVIIITGIVDDRWELSSLIKLIAQILAGVLIFAFSGGIRSLCGIILPLWISLPATVFWVVGIINAFNLIDGLDGLAAGLATIAGVTIAIWMMLTGSKIELAGVMLIFSASCLGFLRYNFSPAKIFMGDTGSMFLGLFFAYWSCNQISHAVTMTSLLVPLLAIGVPVFDVFLAIWRRSIRKLLHPENAVGIMSGDSDHIHHRLMRRTGSQSKAALLAYLIALAFVVLGFLITVANFTLPGIVFLIIVIAIFWGIKLADIELLDSFGFVVNGLAHPKRRLLLIAIHPIVDIAIFFIAFITAYQLGFRAMPQYPFMATFTFLVAPFVLTLCCSGVYRTYWLRAGINRYYLLFKIIFLTIVMDVIIFFVIRNYIPLKVNDTYLFRGGETTAVVSVLLVYYLLIVVVVAAERFLIRYLESFGLRNFYLETHTGSSRQPMQNTLIIGGGLACRLYIESLFCRFHFRRPFKIIGIADDDRAIRKLNVYGFPVLGSTGDLEKLHSRYNIGNVVITAVNIAPDTIERVADFCEKYDIPVSMYHLSDVPCLLNDIRQLANELRICRENN